jgi:DNA-binding NarL/FixJ family response regulator
MAIMDLTEFVHLRNIFPELTDIQLETLMLFSSGFLKKEIASRRCVTVQAVTKTLTECNRKFEISNKESLRNIFLIRVLIYGRLSRQTCYSSISSAN